MAGDRDEDIARDDKVPDGRSQIREDSPDPASQTGRQESARPTDMGEGSGRAGGAGDSSSPIEPPSSPLSSMEREDNTFTDSVTDLSTSKGSAGKRSDYSPLSSPVHFDSPSKNASNEQSPTIPNSPTAEGPKPATPKPRPLSYAAVLVGGGSNTKTDNRGATRGGRGGIPSTPPRSISSGGISSHASPATPPRNLRVARDNLTPPRTRGSSLTSSVSPQDVVQKKPTSRDGQSEEVVDAEMMRELKDVLRVLTTENGDSDSGDVQPAEEEPMTAKFLLMRVARELAADILQRDERLCKIREGFETSMAASAAAKEYNDTLREELENRIKKVNAEAEEAQKAYDSSHEALANAIKLFEVNQESINQAESESAETRADLDRKDAELQQLQATVNSLQQGRQAESSAYVDELRAKVSELSELLKTEQDTSRQIQRELEGKERKWAITDTEREEHQTFMERHLEELQELNQQKEERIESLEQERDDLKRKAAAARPEFIKMLVDGREVTFKEYEKLLTNARGENSSLKHQLEFEKEERERAQMIPLEDVQQAIEPFLKVYGHAYRSALQGLSSDLEQEEEDLKALLSGDGFVPYTHASFVSDSNLVPSQTSSVSSSPYRREYAPRTGDSASPVSQRSSPGVANSMNLQSELAGADSNSEASMSSPTVREAKTPGDERIRTNITLKSVEAPQQDHVDLAEDPHTITRLRVQLKHLMTKLQNLEAEKKGREEDIARLRTEVASLKSKITVHQQIAEQLKAEIARATSNMNSDQHKGLAEQQDRMNSLFNNLQDCKQRLAVALSQRDALQREIEERQAELEVWQSTGEEIGNINVALDEQAAKNAHALTASGARKAELEAQVADLESRLQDADLKTRQERDRRVEVEARDRQATIDEDALVAGELQRAEMESKIEFLERKLRYANHNTSEERERRRQAEHKGVWEGTAKEALKAKGKEIKQLRDELQEERNSTEQNLRLEEDEAKDKEIKQLRDELEKERTNTEQRLRLEEEEAEKLDTYVKTLEESLEASTEEASRARMELQHHATAHVAVQTEAAQETSPRTQQPANAPQPFVPPRNEPLVSGLDPWERRVLQGTRLAQARLALLECSRRKRYSYEETVVHQPEEIRQLLDELFDLGERLSAVLAGTGSPDDTRQSLGAFMTHKQERIRDITASIDARANSVRDGIASWGPAFNILLREMSDHPALPPPQPSQIVAEETPLGVAEPPLPPGPMGTQELIDRWGAGERPFAFPSGRAGSPDDGGDGSSDGSSVDDSDNDAELVSDNPVQRDIDIVYLLLEKLDEAVQAAMESKLLVCDIRRLDALRMRDALDGTGALAPYGHATPHSTVGPPSSQGSSSGGSYNAGPSVFSESNRDGHPASTFSAPLAAAMREWERHANGVKIRSEALRAAFEDVLQHVVNAARYEMMRSQARQFLLERDELLRALRGENPDLTRLFSRSEQEIRDENEALRRTNADLSRTVNEGHGDREAHRNLELEVARLRSLNTVNENSRRLAEERRAEAEQSRDEFARQATETLEAANGHLRQMVADAHTERDGIRDELDRHIRTRSARTEHLEERVRFLELQLRNSERPRIAAEDSYKMLRIGLKSILQQGGDDIDGANLRFFISRAFNPEQHVPSLDNVGAEGLDPSDDEDSVIDLDADGHDTDHLLNDHDPNGDPDEHDGIVIDDDMSPREQNLATRLQNWQRTTHALRGEISELHRSFSGTMEDYRVAHDRELVERDQRLSRLQAEFELSEDDRIAAANRNTELEARIVGLEAELIQQNELLETPTRSLEQPNEDATPGRPLTLQRGNSHSSSSSSGSDGSNPSPTGDHPAGGRPPGDLRDGEASPLRRDDPRNRLTDVQAPPSPGNESDNSLPSPDVAEDENNEMAMPQEIDNILPREATQASPRASPPASPVAPVVQFAEEEVEEVAPLQEPHNEINVVEGADHPTPALQTNNTPGPNGAGDARVTRPNDGNYAWQVMLAIRDCLKGHCLSWANVVWFCCMFGYWLIATPFGKGFPLLAQRPTPRRVSVFLVDAIWLVTLSSMFWWVIKAVMTLQAVKDLWDLANGRSRAYYVESLLQTPIKLLGLDGTDVRFSPSLSLVAETVLQSVVQAGASVTA